MTLNGVCSGFGGEDGDVVGRTSWDAAFGCGLDKSVREVEAKRSSTADTAFVGLLEAWVLDAS